MSHYCEITRVKKTHKNSTSGSKMQHRTDMSVGCLGCFQIGAEWHLILNRRQNLPRIPRFAVCSSAAVSNMEERERKSVKSNRKETATPSCSSTPPVPERGPEAGGATGDDDADKIDVCSDKFDPLLALYSPTVQVPFPNVKCFNNVSAYESFLRGGRGRAKPENVEKKRLKAMKGVVDPERIERLKKLMVNNPTPQSEEGEGSSSAPRRRQKPKKNVLTRMPCRFSNY